MNHQEILEHYKQVASFLGEVLGPGYETVLYDMKKRHPVIIAIHNGGISGRSVGSPMSNMVKRMVAEGNDKNKERILNYRGLAASGKTLRCSTMFIRGEDHELIGLLCVNFDDTRFMELSRDIFALVHPDQYIRENISISFTEHAEDGNLSDSVSDIIDEALLTVAGTIRSALSYEQKLEVIRILNNRNVFQIKGAVSIVANRLSSSQASVYRYLSEIRHSEGSA